jgi:hypothetical protein
MHVAQKFLSYFGSPLVKLNEPSFEIAEPSKRVSRSKVMGLDTLLNINNQAPYPISFTPNGNYGDNNNVLWLKAERAKWREGKKPYRNAIYIDLDMKDTSYSNLDEYFDYLIGIFETPGFIYQPTFITKSWWGFHLYRIFSDVDKKLINKRISDSDMESVIKYVASNFDGGDTQWWRTKVNALARLPFGKYRRKDWSIVPLILYQVIKQEDWHYTYKHIQSDSDFDDEKLLTKIGFVQVKTMQNNILQNKKAEKAEIPMHVSTDAGIVETQVKTIPFPKILEKLSAYPKQYGDKIYTYEIKHNKLLIKYPDGTYAPDGYTYKSDENYVCNFTAESHPIEERPAWNVMAFLYYHFNMSVPRVAEFLNKEFGIKITKDAALSEGKEIFRQITKPTYTVTCTEDKIEILQQVTKKDWSIASLPYVLFQKPFEIVGKGEVDFKDMGELDVNEKVLICKLYDSDKPFILKTFAAKRPLNDDIMKYGLFFFGDDNQLGMFYQAVLDNDDIPTYDIIHLNWYYDGIYVLGWKINEIETSNKNYYFIPRFEFKLKTWTQVTCEEYLSKWLWLRDPCIWIPSFLQSLALAGMNIRNDVPGVSVYPGLFVTGQTASGKTILTETLKGMLWYAKKARQYSITRITPQPLMHWATDNSILNLEEFTWDYINPNIQWPLRDIIDRRVASKWQIGKNIVYNFRSPLMVLWETLPDMASVTNRFVVIPMDARYQIGTKEWLYEIEQYVCTDEVYNQRYQLAKDPLKIAQCYGKRVKYLVDNKLDPRYADVRAYIFTMNELFEINIEQDKLLEYTKKNLKNIGYYGDKKINSTYAKLQSFFVQAMIKKKVHVTSRSSWKKDIVTLFFDGDRINKKKAELSQIVNDLNQELETWLSAWNWHPDWDYQPIQFDNAQVIMKINFTHSSPLDETINDFRDKFLVMLWNNFVSIAN